MDNLPPFAFRKNLEQFAPDIAVGNWRIGAYVDLVSERKFLLYRLKLEDLSQLDPGVITFRSQSASALAPARCPEIIDVVQKNRRLDFLTPYVALVDPTALTDTDVENLFRAVIETLSQFEKYRFYASGLVLESIGRDADGEFFIMPNAFVLPQDVHDTSEARSREDTVNRLSGGYDDVGPSVHLDSLADLMGRFAHSGEGTSQGHAEGTDSANVGAFRRLLIETAAAVTAREIRSLGELSERLFGQPVDPAAASFVAGIRSVESDASLAETDEILSNLSGGAIIEITGGDASDKSKMLRRLASRAASTNHFVSWIDDWDLAALTRKKPASRDMVTGSVLWLIDDIEDKTFFYSQLSERLFDQDGSPEDRINLVYTLNPPEASDELVGFLRTLKNRAGDRFHRLDRTETGDGTALADRVEDLLSVVRPAAKAASGVHGSQSRDGLDLTEELLTHLHPEERQILELASVARVPLPHEIVRSVFTQSNGELHKRLHHLAGLDVLEVQYRKMPPSHQLSITFKIKSNSLRRAVYACITPERRENLHRTVARMAEDRGGVPTIVVFEHLIKGREPQLAAQYGVAFLKETNQEKRDPYLNVMIDELITNGLHKKLSFADQLFTFRELGADLAAGGRRAEAEKLLLDAKAIIETADSEEKHKNPSIVSEIIRLLADTWGDRGNYSQALTLLTDAKASLNPFLSLPAQACLLNDIGWLQYRLGNYDEAVDSCKLSLNTLNPNEHPLIVAQALNLMGVIHFNTSRYDEAISYYDQSAFLREREGDVNALSASYNNLALAYQTKGEYDKALSYYNKSLEIKKLQNNEAGIAGVYLNLALLHLEVHNFEEAEKKCRESLEISNDLGYTRLTTEIYSTLGDINFTRGHFDRAEEYFQRSLDMAQSLELINEEMGAHRRLAKLYLNKKRFEDAHEAIEQASRLGNQIGSWYENAQIETILGDLNFEENRNEDAIRCYEIAASSYANVSKYRLVAPLLAKIGLVHARSGNTFEAKQHLDRALDLIRSEIGHEIPNEIATLQQMLRERPVKKVPTGNESQELLYAFYELSSLTDYADDRNAFFDRIITVFQDLTGSTSCFLALQTEDNAFVMIDRAGDQERLTDMGLRALFQRAQQLGGLLDSTSEEVSDLLGQIKIPAKSMFVCVPMRATGKNLGCLFVYVPEGRLPLSKEDANFFTSIGRHIAGDIRLMLHLEEHAHKEETLEKEFESLKAQVVDQYRFENLIGKNESMKKIFRNLEKVKDMDTGLLILGESGTGKTELARAIHYNSPRRKRLFQQLHCAEIPVNLLESELFGHEKGAFTGAVQRKLGRCEVADGGTVFLDDVNVMQIETQTKLLHYLESKSFMRLGGTTKITTNVRIIASSNENLETLVKAGQFREDLYYRLKILLIELPPLRERKEDMIAIALAFIKKRCQDQGKPLKTLAPETIKLFQKYPWPGNVRELQNVLEQVVLLSDEDIIAPASLPDDFLKKATGSSRQLLRSLESLAQQIVESGSYSESNPLMPQLEALLASKMSQHVDGKGKAASLLGITKPTLYTRLRGYDKMH